MVLIRLTEGSSRLSYVGRTCLQRGRGHTLCVCVSLSETHVCARTHTVDNGEIHSIDCP